VVEKAVSAVSAQSKKQGVDVKIEKTGGIGEVFLDPEQMQYALVNIMLASLRSMPGGGALTVGITAVPGSREVEIAVSDTGPGLKAEDEEDLFKPFFSAAREGSGLGMAISKHTVERHGGRITVEGRGGPGSLVRVFLPLGTKDV
jgi:signal transduction histidine kinase